MRITKNLAFCLLAAVLGIFQSSCSEKKDNAEVKLSVITSLDRVRQDEKVNGKAQADIKAAKNEFESFQVVVEAPEKNIRVTAAEISDLKGDAGTISSKNISLFREEYARVRRSSPMAQLAPGLYPDPLVPFVNPLTGKPIEPFNQYRVKWGTPFISSGYHMYAVPFDVWKGQNQPIWIDIYVPKETAAGEYKGTFTISVTTPPDQFGPAPDTVKTTSVSIPVTLTVWDFTIPDGPTHKNHFGHVNRMNRLFNVEPDTPEADEIEMRYCQMLADHRINPPIPERFMPEVKPDGSLIISPEKTEALKKYLNDLHVTDFQIPNAPFKDMTTVNRDKAIKYYREIYKYLKDNGWDKRAYLYMLDEPNLSENYQQVLDLGALAHEAAPEIRCLVVEQTYTQDPSWPDMDPAIDIWCPLFAFIDRKSIDEKLSHGDEVWSYTALSQRTPPYHPDYEKLKNYDSPYWHLDAMLTSYRTPTWMNWQYKITGLLYWSVVTISQNVTGVMEPWMLPAFTESDSQFNAGGYLLYPGTPCGINGPISCIRLKALRDSMEDWEYFEILTGLSSRDEVTKLVSEIAPEWWNTSEDPAQINATREKIANEIIRLKK